MSREQIQKLTQKLTQKLSPTVHRHGHWTEAQTAWMCRRWAGIGALLAGLLLAVLARPVAAAPARQAAPCDWTNQSYSDFYDPPPLGAFDPARLGEILRVEHIKSYTREDLAEELNRPSSQYGAQVYRILYRSQTPPGTSRAVSGMLVVPTGEAPAGGFPILAHGAGTVGMADQCAPSKRALLAEAPLLPWAADGFVAVSSDYVGLGTPGPRPAY